MDEEKTNDDKICDEPKVNDVVKMNGDVEKVNVDEKVKEIDKVNVEEEPSPELFKQRPKRRKKTQKATQRVSYDSDSIDVDVLTTLNPNSFGASVRQAEVVSDQENAFAVLMKKPLNKDYIIDKENVEVNCEDEIQKASEVEGNSESEVKENSESEVKVKSESGKVKRGRKRKKSNNGNEEMKSEANGMVNDVKVEVKAEKCVNQVQEDGGKKDSGRKMCF